MVALSKRMHTHTHTHIHTGLIHTDDSITRAFSLQRRMAMSINLLSLNDFAQHINSLVWYHNGTRVTSDDRVHIINNGTELTISNVVQSDAGKYEVKINSIENAGGSSETCDMTLLPMLEHLAFHAPVTFILHESSILSYNPEEDVITDYYIPAYQGTSLQSVTIDNVIKINSSSVLENNFSKDYGLYKDGIRVYDVNTFNSTVSYSNDIMQSLRISYNNTDDITGHYVYLAYTLSQDIESRTCPQYNNYIRRFTYRLPIFVLYWNIKVYGKLKQLK